MTAEEYLEIERKAEFKSEFWQGEMYAMAGAGRAHNLVVSNLTREIGNQIRSRPCEGYAADMRVQVSTTGLYTYRDFVVVCGEPRFLAAANSSCIARSNRSGNISSYRPRACWWSALPVSPPTKWLLTATDKLEEVIRLESIECDLRLADLYEKVEFG